MIGITESRRVPVPVVNEETRPFWDATADGKLLLKRCGSCGEFHYYPRTICPFCMSDDTRWVESTGRGVIYSYSIFRRAPVPYCLAYVTVEEGVTLMTNIIGVEFEQIKIGMPVNVLFVDTGEGCSLPFFTSVEDDAVGTTNSTGNGAR